MPMEVGKNLLAEGDNLYVDQGVAWSGKLSLFSEVMIVRNGKPALGGVSAYAQLFRLKDIKEWDFSVHIGEVNSYGDLISSLEEKLDRAVSPEEIVTVVTLRLSDAQAKLVNQKEYLS